MFTGVANAVVIVIDKQVHRRPARARQSAIIRYEFLPALIIAERDIESCAYRPPVLEIRTHIKRKIVIVNPNRQLVAKKQTSVVRQLLAQSKVVVQAWCHVPVSRHRDLPQRLRTRKYIVQLATHRYAFNPARDFQATVCNVGTGGNEMIEVVGQVQSTEARAQLIEQAQIGWAVRTVLMPEAKRVRVSPVAADRSEQS